MVNKFIFRNIRLVIKMIYSDLSIFIPYLIEINGNDYIFILICCLRILTLINIAGGDRLKWHNEKDEYGAVNHRKVLIRSTYFSLSDNGADFFS